MRAGLPPGVGALTRCDDSDVTRMSESLPVSPRVFGGKCSRSLRHSRLARAVHSLASVVVAPAVLAGSIAVPMLAGGCVVPPPLDPDISADAGPNSPPVIVEARDSALNPLRPPTSITVVRGAVAMIGLTVLDTDAADTVNVRVFVDYDRDPLGPRSECVAPPAADGTSTRTTDCPTQPLCLTGDTTSNPHLLEIEVYDRPLVLGSSTFRETTPPGLFSTWTFDLFCVDNL
jgi:hypothetical protein